MKRLKDSGTPDGEATKGKRPQSRGRLRLAPAGAAKVSIAFPDGLMTGLGERFVVLRPPTPSTPVRRILSSARADRGFWRMFAASIALAGAVGLMVSYLAHPPTVEAASCGAERRK